jgi:hypothetical protein
MNARDTIIGPGSRGIGITLFVEFQLPVRTVQEPVGGEHNMGGRGAVAQRRRDAQELIPLLTNEGRVDGS